MPTERKVKYTEIKPGMIIKGFGLVLQIQDDYVFFIEDQDAYWGQSSTKLSRTREYTELCFSNEEYNQYIHGVIIAMTVHVKDLEDCSKAVLEYFKDVK